MNRTNSCTWFVIAALTVFVVGCGGGEDATEHTDVEPPSLGTTDMPTTGETGGDTALNTDAGGEAKATEFVPVFADKGARDPFAAPEVMPEIDDPEPEPEPVMSSDLPPMRRVGFVKVDRERAMLKFDDELVLVSAGDAVGRVEIVEVKSPSLTIKFRDEQIALNLFGRESTDGWQEITNREGLKIRRMGETAPVVDSQVRTRETNPRLTLPTLPPSVEPTGSQTGGIPGLPGGEALPPMSDFPEIEET